MTETLEVSQSYTCSNETRTLGEAFTEIEVVEAAFGKLVDALQNARKTGSQMVDDRASDFLNRVRDARYDASWYELFCDAEEAHAEAAVRTIVRSPAP